MERRTKVALATAGGLLTLGLAFWRRKDVFLAFDAVKAEAFKLALPTSVRQYASAILAAANATGLSPLVIYGVGARESSWGATLRPAGPGGTGDFTPRDATAWGSMLPPITGRDGRQVGWGFGLMQLDYHAYKGWLASNAWWDPSVMILKGAQVLKQRMDFFASKSPYKFTSTSMLTDGKLVKFNAGNRWGVTATYLPDPRPLSGELLIRAALAAYNGGDANVLRSVAAGKSPDFTTTGADYSQWILSRIVPMYQKIMG